MEPHVVHSKKIDLNSRLLAVSFFQSRASLIFPSNVISKLASHCCCSSAYIHKRKRWSNSALLGSEPTTFLIHNLSNWRLRPLDHRGSTPWNSVCLCYSNLCGEWIFFDLVGKWPNLKQTAKIIWLPSPKQIKCQQTSKYPLQKIRFFGLETTIKKGGGGIFQSILVPINGSVLSQDCLKKYFGARFEKIDPKLSTCIFGKKHFANIKNVIYHKMSESKLIWKSFQRRQNVLWPLTNNFFFFL